MDKKHALTLAPSELSNWLGEVGHDEQAGEGNASRSARVRFPAAKKQRQLLETSRKVRTIRELSHRNKNEGFPF